MPRTGSKYSGDHPATRAYWSPLVRRGGVRCWRCGRGIVPMPGVKGEGWQLGHRVAGPSLPEHPKCNMSAGGRVGAMITNARRRRTARPAVPRRTRAW